MRDYLRPTGLGFFVGGLMGPGLPLLLLRLTLAVSPFGKDISSVKLLTPDNMELDRPLPSRSEFGVLTCESPKLLVIGGN